MFWLAHLLPNQRTEVKLRHWKKKKKDNYKLVWMSFLFSLITTISMPSLDLKKVASNTLLLYTFMCRLWKGKKKKNLEDLSNRKRVKPVSLNDLCLGPNDKNFCYALSAHQLAMTEEKDFNVCHVSLCVTSAVRPCKRQMWFPEEQEICPVETNAVFVTLWWDCIMLCRAVIIHTQNRFDQKVDQEEVQEGGLWSKRILTVNTHFSSCSYTRKIVNCSRCCSPPELLS